MQIVEQIGNEQNPIEYKQMVKKNIVIVCRNYNMVEIVWYY